MTTDKKYTKAGKAQASPNNWLALTRAAQQNCNTPVVKQYAPLYLQKP